MGKWITAFASAQREMREGGGFAGRTARLRWTANLTGDTLRLRFANASPDKPANASPDKPMRMGPVTVWSGKGSAEITFGGQPVLQLACSWPRAALPRATRPFCRSKRGIP